MSSQTIEQLEKENVKLREALRKIARLRLGNSSSPALMVLDRALKLATEALS